MTINEMILNGLADTRKLDPETIVRLGISTGSYRGDGDDREIVDDPNGNILIFPMVERGQVVGHKYRRPGKLFSQRKGGRRTFFNSDVLDDPTALAGANAVVITEGEFDCITALQQGFLAMSVPDGAPAVRDGETPDELQEWEERDDTDGKFQYVYNNRDRIKHIKRFILAVDNDPPGKRLAAELVRRLGAARCASVEYPEGCKDLNEVLVKCGPAMVSKVLNSAKAYPVRGLFKMSDYQDIPQPQTYSTGWLELDPLLKPYRGEFIVVTGIPGTGKSTWVNSLATNLAEQHDWSIAIASFEARPVPFLRDFFRRRIAGPLFGHESQRESVVEADKWANDHFVFIDYDPRHDDDDIDLNWLIERAEDAVLRYGIDCLVIDPWNEIDHKREHGETETEYTNRAIRALKRFSRSYDVTVIVVAHPTKLDVGKNGKLPRPTAYNISGSAAWFNKPDHVIVIDRDISNRTVVDVKKVRHAFAGQNGEVVMNWNKTLGVYEDIPDEVLSGRPGDML